MIVKLPACYDVSFWQGKIDWSQVTPRPLVVICKATEGSTVQDPTFRDNFSGLKVNGILRGVYHFHRRAITATAQAKNFLDFVHGLIGPNDFICLDVEEGGETAAQLIAWLDLVEHVYPNNLILIYSRKNILDPIARVLSFFGLHDGEKRTTLEYMTLTSSEAARLRTYPLWIAGYPINPDLYNSIPSGYIPDQAKWGPVYLWQYSDKGRIANSSTVDLNWIAPVFQALLQTPEPTVEHSQPFPGFDEYVEVVNGVRCHISLVDMEGRHLHVRHFGGALGYVSVVAKEVGVLCSFNGIDYDKQAPALLPYGPAYSEGIKVNGSNPDFRYFMNSNQDGFLAFGYRDILHYYNTTAFVRPLLIDGAIHTALQDKNKIENLELHARSALGYLADGRILQIVAEGKYPATGLTLPQIAELGKKYGAIYLGEHGGGGDSQKAISGKLVNAPSDPTERPVVQVITITGKRETMNGTAKESLGNNTTKRDTPSRYGKSVGTILARNTIEFVKVVNVMIKGVLDNPNDQWFALPDRSYVNYILNGVQVYTILTQPTPDIPPSSTNKTLDVKLTEDDGSVWVGQVKLTKQ